MVFVDVCREPTSARTATAVLMGARGLAGALLDLRRRRPRPATSLRPAPSSLPFFMLTPSPPPSESNISRQLPRGAPAAPPRAPKSIDKSEFLDGRAATADPEGAPHLDISIRSLSHVLQRRMRAPHRDQPPIIQEHLPVQLPRRGRRGPPSTSRRSAGPAGRRRARRIARGPRRAPSSFPPSPLRPASASPWLMK